MVQWVAPYLYPSTGLPYLSGLPLGAMLDEVLRHVHMTPFGSSTRQCCLVLVLECRVGAVLDERGHIHMPLEGRRRSGVVSHLSWAAG